MRNIKIFLQFAKCKTVLALFFAFPCFAQQISDAKKIDSLLQVVKVCKVDTTKVNLYFEVCRKLYNKDIKQVSFYNKLIYSISKKLNYTMGFAHNNQVLATCHYMLGENDLAIKHALLAKKTYQIKNDLINVANMQYIISFALVKKHKYSEGKDIATSALEAIKQTKFYDQKIKLHYALAAAYNQTNNLDEAIYHLKQILNLSKSTTNKVFEITAYNEISLNYFLNFQYQHALKYCLIGLSKINKDSEGSKIHTTFLNNAACLNLELKNYKLAKYYAQKTFYWANKNNDTYLMLYSQNINASIHVAKKNYINAIAISLKVLKTAIDDDVRQIALQNLGTSYYEQKQYQKAKYFQELQLKTIPNTNDVYNHYMIFNALAATEKALKNYEKALFYKTKFASMQDIYLTELNQKKINEIQLKFNKKEDDIKYKIIALEQQKNYAELKKGKLYFFATVFVIILLISIITVLVYFYKKNRFKNAVIEQKKMKLEKSEIDLKNALQIQNILLKELHHRVKNNMQLTISILNIQSRKLNFKSIDDFMDSARQRIEAMSLVHESLCKTKDVERVNFQSYLSDLVDNLRKSFRDDKILFLINAQNLNFNLQTAIPLGIITNELVCNAFKHAFPKNSGTVTIIVEEYKNNYRLSVSDDGVGFNANEVNKKSFGLDLVSMLASQLKGHLETKIETNTTFEIYFTEIKSTM